MSTVQQVVFTLNECSVFPMSPSRQEAIAEKVLQDGFGAEEVAKLYKVSRRSSRTVFDASAQLAKLLQEDKRYILKVLSGADKLLEETEDRKFGDRPLGSHIKFCTEANPYGWANPELLRGLDHDLPGETKRVLGNSGHLINGKVTKECWPSSNQLDGWNPFRQCYNLTTQERQKLKTNDHRRRGCSRYEVLGTKTKQVPSLQWDQAEWERAMQFSSGSEPITKIGGEQKVEEREVYGA